MKLPDAPWRHRPGLDQLCAVLRGEARFVGGVVRDTVAGLEPKDIDLATSLSPDDVIKRCAAAGIKTVPTGIAHGTVTAVVEKTPVEITTLRRDVSTDGRRATIAFTSDWQQDAARRDFTINALYADPESGEIFDYFGGIDDLTTGLVRFIGAPLQRIAEDHLRILRYFRFHARFGNGAPHAESLAACAARANDLMALSRERIALEVLAILSLNDPGPVIAMMLAHGIFKPVLPEIAGAEALTRLILREKQGFAPNPIRRLAALIPADPALAVTIANRLKLSNAQRKHLVALAERSEADLPRPLAYHIGTAAAQDRLLLGTGDAVLLNGWTPPRFPLSGGAIVARGIVPGPEVARLLREIESRWIAADFPGKAELRALADEVLPPAK